MKRLKEGVYITKTGSFFVAQEWCHGGWYFHHDKDKDPYRRISFSMWRDYLINRCKYLGKL